MITVRQTNNGDAEKAFKTADYVEMGRSNFSFMLRLALFLNFVPK